MEKSGRKFRTGQEKQKSCSCGVLSLSGSFFCCNLNYFGLCTDILKSISGLFSSMQKKKMKYLTIKKKLIIIGRWGVWILQVLFLFHGSKVQIGVINIVIFWYLLPGERACWSFDIKRSFFFLEARNREGAKPECTICVVSAALWYNNREKTLLVEEVDVKILFF